MRRMTFLVPIAVAGWLVTVGGQAPSTSATVFENARVIVGDGRGPIENATFGVTGSGFAELGRVSDVKAPAGATRINLAGKTVMPAIVDTHNHLSQTREAITDDLRRRAYFGVAAGMKIGRGAG